MHHALARTAISLLLSTFATGYVCAADEGASRLDCTNGPVEKTFGAAPWLVFGCSDGSSVVVVSAKHNPAHPFFFKLFIKDGKRYVVGEGKGVEAVTAATYADLAKLSEADIAALITAAAAVPEAALD